MNQVMMCLLVAAAMFSVSCKDSDTNGGGGGTINPNIKLVRYCCTAFGGGNFRMGVWYADKLFYVAPARLLRMNDLFDLVQDTLILREPYLFVSKNNSGTRLLIVKSLFTDVSVGKLCELDLQTSQMQTLKDSLSNVSSAGYLPIENQCIYYSYGNSSRQIPAGYYKLDLSTLQDTLLFEYISEIGPAEVTNGFDISPDGTKLLFPINRAAEPPLLVEHMLATGIRETLNLSFDRQLLWVRYHPSGSQILYSNYPRGAGGSTVATDSEIGVIEKADLSKRVLDTNPFVDQGWRAVSVFPNWSPDGRHIVYGSTKGPAIEPPGAKGTYSLYILKNVN